MATSRHEHALKAKFPRDAQSRVQLLEQNKNLETEKQNSPKSFEDTEVNDVVYYS